MTGHLRILCSDDDEGIRSLLFALLSEQGHTVEFARSGDEVFKHLGRAKYDLLILDVNTPGMNGYKVSEKITSNIINRPKILIFTARDIVAEKLQFIYCGADAVIRKGAPCDSILDAIDELFSIATPEERHGEPPSQNGIKEINMENANTADISNSTRGRIEGDLQYCLKKMTQVEDHMTAKDMRYEEFIRDLLREKQRTEKNYLEFKRIEQEVLRMKNWGYVVAAIAGVSLLKSFL